MFTVQCHARFGLQTRRYLPLACLIGGLIAPTLLCGAEMLSLWRCTDAQGQQTLTSQKEDTKGKSCQLLYHQRNTVPTKPGALSTSASLDTRSVATLIVPSNGFPRESGQDRANARLRQRQAIEAELQGEALVLARARKELSEQEVLVAAVDRSTVGNEMRLQRYRDNVRMHERNVEDLRRELDKLK